MSEDIARIVTQLFAKQTNGKELSAQVQHLGEEIRKVIQSENTVFGKFLGLLESFREIIPDEQQRYLAALKALSTTLKLPPQEIKKAINGQLDELKILEKGLVPTQHAWRDELKGMEARSQQLEGEMTQLRERLKQLESEEKALRSAMSVREKDMALAEKTVRELFANIVAEVSAFNKKVSELTVDAPAAHPVASPAQAGQQMGSQKNVAAGTGKNGEQTVEAGAAQAKQDTKYQKKCPLCGGPFNLLEYQNIWQCYSCAYEEPNR